LNVFNQTVPDIHPDKAFALHNTGLVHYAMGHLDESRDFHEKSLKMRELSLPPQHPYIAQSCYRLGIIYEEQGQYKSALEYSERALIIYEKDPVNNATHISEVQVVIKRLHEKLTTL
jgi:tetratricopeptide (TPR) repeat protein